MKKPVSLSRTLDAFLHVVGQAPHVVGAVDLIGHGVAVGQMLVDEDGLAGSAVTALGLGLGLDHRVAGLLGQGRRGGLVLLACRWA